MSSVSQGDSATARTVEWPFGDDVSGIVGILEGLRPDAEIDAY